MIIEINLPKFKKVQWMWRCLRYASKFYDKPLGQIDVPNPYSKDGATWRVNTRYAIVSLLEELVKIDTAKPTAEAMFATAYEKERERGVMLMRENYDSPGRRRAIKERAA